MWISAYDPQMHRQRAFSLIEAAIVLAVVGLVIGGIWVAASAVHENRKVNQVSTGILTVVQNARRLFPLQLAPGFHSLTGDLTRMLIEGADNFQIVGVVAMHPLGGASDGWNPMTIQIQPSFIGITLYSLNKARCMNLIATTTSRFKDQSNLINASDGNITPYTSFPVTINTTNLCTTPVDPTDPNSHYVSFAFQR